MKHPFTEKKAKDLGFSDEQIKNIKGIESHTAAFDTGNTVYIATSKSIFTDQEALKKYYFEGPIIAFPLYDESNNAP